MRQNLDMAWRVSVEERWAELERLHGCKSPDDLHRALVLHRPAVVEREPSMAIAWFRTAHQTDITLRGQTVALLATDPRCKTIARPLMQRIVEHELVETNELDVLAETFLRADKHLYWRCPDHWFDGPVIVLTERGPDHEAAEPAAVPDDPALAQRDVPPALRRWATARLTATNPERWAGFAARARQLDGDAGGGIIRGLLDAADALPAAAVEHIRTIARSWPRQEVRSAADAEPRTPRARTLKADVNAARIPSQRRSPTARSAPSSQPSLFE